MKTITAAQVSACVAALCVKANVYLRPDVRKALERAKRSERNPRSQRLMAAIAKNASVARTRGLAICQDTGLPVVMIRLGQGVRLTGGGLAAAVNKGVRDGYRKASLRNSIVPDPVLRGASSFTPAVIHTEVVPGRSMRITVLPKGFGCENKSRLMMFKPTASWDEIQSFVIDTVKAAGADACPPYVVGIGIGGTAEYAMFLAKKALLRTIEERPRDARERKLREALNALHIGPMGLGGAATVLAVHIAQFPTHIAGLPVAVNISCHALRSAQATL